MARIERKVAGLIMRDAGIVESIRIVLEKSEDGEVELDWADVRGEITSGHWGRLIETGILKEGKKGFQVSDAFTIKQAIEHFDKPGSKKSKTKLDDEGKWTKWDKGAAVFAICLFAGYSFAEVREIIGKGVDLVIGPIDAVLPFYLVIMILALFTGLYSTLLQANLMNMEKMGEYQIEMKELQERQKAAQKSGDKEEMERLRKEQMEAMGDQMGMFKLQFRPMVWIMIFTIPVFLWIYWKILSGNIDSNELTIIVPFVGEVDWMEGLIGPIQLWIVWYFMSSMAFTQVIRKALNIRTGAS
jgi:uncharacterized membrane protein (DUF106 family)